MAKNFELKNEQKMMISTTKLNLFWEKVQQEKDAKWEKERKEAEKKGELPAVGDICVSGYFKMVVRSDEYDIFADSDGEEFIMCEVGYNNKGRLTIKTDHLYADFEGVMKC
jgi:hypothetical protein